MIAIQSLLATSVNLYAPKWSYGGKQKKGASSNEAASKANLFGKSPLA